MVQFIHENWLYWLVIDAVAVVLYARRGLYLGAALFALYGVMAASAYFEWGWFVW
jgi:nicotinamide mononucleotide transporter